MAECPVSAAVRAEESAAAHVYKRLDAARVMTLEEKASAFLDLLASEDGGPGVSPDRRREVAAEIASRGFYEHTEEELLWGCRFAWRHSTRCIGRYFWRQLEVRDARKAASPAEVAEHCVRHVRESTNGGAVRSMVTVFAPREGASGWRIWNHQLVRYAGYRSEDGEVLGDPAEAEFTEHCVRLGWKPPGSRSKFDPLPLVISPPNGAPEVFELPGDAVLEVALTHPEYDWFHSLGLRWYAVPIVSNMLLEIGGIHYPAAPFNGWYMGTEIGARNLADLGRYDMLPEIAAGMGIWERREASLWRDRALVELNRAVLYSYQNAGVRIVDHHTASRLHVRFEEEECAAGRPVTGRWDWLVPPVSGSATPLWSRSYDPTEYSPNFFPQNPAWI